MADSKKTKKDFLLRQRDDTRRLGVQPGEFCVFTNTFGPVSGTQLPTSAISLDQQEDSPDLKRDAARYSARVELGHLGRMGRRRQCEHRARTQSNETGQVLLMKLVLLTSLIFANNRSYSLKATALSTVLECCGIVGA
jgi:hypothetical protein